MGIDEIRLLAQDVYVGINYKALASIDALIGLEKLAVEQAAEIERLKELYSFQLTGDESSGMIQLELQEGDRELEIEFSPNMQVRYLKTDAEQSQEGEVLRPSQLLLLLQWLKGGE